jgi:hypothetical protein
MESQGIDKFGEEGGLKPQVSRKHRFTREIAAIAFSTASFQTSRVKRREVPRSAKKPKKWRKTVARSNPIDKYEYGLLGSKSIFTVHGCDIKTLSLLLD